MPGVTLETLGARAVAASRELALATTDEKNDALLAAAYLLAESADEILEENRLDMATAQTASSVPAVIDRLRLDRRRIADMSEALRAVAALPEVVGEVVDGGVRPNGLVVERVRVPLGVVGIIYENRPNVTSDAAALCLKSGNAALLRGSGAALRTNRAVASVLRSALEKAGLPRDGVVLVEDTSHETAEQFVRLEGVIDCLIPRGGAGLVAMVRERATVPYVLDGDGNCHVYVDESADVEMARAIVLNAKTSRPSVCNAAESLVLHGAIAPVFLAAAVPDLVAAGVELVGDERARALVAEMGEADEEDFAREYLSLKMSVAIVDSLTEAIAHVRRFSSGHSEAIVTSDLRAARRFAREVDAAAVLVNASTRFVDGGELGLGAEVGISTQKLHARGPMGLRELTTVKYVIHGDGQVRK